MTLTPDKTQHTHGQQKIYFKNQQKVCPGRRGMGDCQQCLENFPQIALGCNNMGEYLNKKDWNRIFANSPLYNKDINPRETLEEELYDGKRTKYSKNGKRLNRFGVPVGRNGF